MPVVIPLITPAARPPVQDFETFLEPLFAAFKAQRRGADETFGDFCARVGFEALREAQANYISPAVAEKLPKVGWCRGWRWQSVWTYMLAATGMMCRSHSVYVGDSAA